MAFSLDQYYLGIIIPELVYYQNSNPKKSRMLNGVSFDPFEEVAPLYALIFGVPTLLRKEDDLYYDEYYSRWKNEVAYQEGEPNLLGIILGYVKPFREYYPEASHTYIKEDVENDPSLMRQLWEEHSFYIAHSRLDRSDAIVLFDEEPMKQLQIDYINHLCFESGVKPFIKRRD